MQLDKARTINDCGSCWRSFSALASQQVARYKDYSRALRSRVHPKSGATGIYCLLLCFGKMSDKAADTIQMKPGHRHSVCLAVLALFDLRPHVVLSHAFHGSQLGQDGVRFRGGRTLLLLWRCLTASSLRLAGIALACGCAAGCATACGCATPLPLPRPVSLRSLAICVAVFSLLVWRLPLAVCVAAASPPSSSAGNLPIFLSNVALG